jgi:hypothetical protein
VAGVPEENAEVEIHQVGGVHDSMVCQLPEGGAGYILDLEINNQTSGTIYCSEIELRMPWQDTRFGWLPDPRDTGRRFQYLRRRRGNWQLVDAPSESYHFSGGVELDYPRALVLNHVLLKRRTLRPRGSLKGLLLAIGGPMPHNLRHGEWIKSTFAIIASNGVEYATTLDLWTDRLVVKPKRATRGNLFEPLAPQRSFHRNQADILVTEKSGRRVPGQDGQVL